MKKDARTIVSMLAVLAGAACVAGGAVPANGDMQPLGEGEVYGPNGMPQRVDIKSPEWIAPVLAAEFDGSFQDMRTDTFIHEEISRVIADGRYVMVMGDPNTQFPRIAPCFSSDSQPTQEIIDAVNAAILGSFGERFEIGGSWNGGAVNTIRSINWSFVPDGTSIPGGPSATANSTLFATLNSQFANNGGQAAWISLFQQVFDRWAALTGLSYIRRTASGVEWDDGASWGTSGGPTRGDVRIAMKPIDGGGGILAYNQFPGSGNGGDMVLDSGDTWDGTTNNFRFTRNVIAHEHGHGIGLAHVCPLGSSAAQYKLMEPFINTAYDGPQQDDVRGAQFNYGDINEPNNLLANATDLGTLANGSTTSLGGVSGTLIPNTTTLSIVSRTAAAGGASTDFDWYKVNLATPRLVTYSVNAAGSTYNAGPQTQACNTGGSINARNVHDLSFIVYRSNGTIELANINATGIGANETEASVLLPAGDTYFVVTNDLADGTTGTQQYTASIQVLTNNLTPVASNSLTDKIRVTWSQVPNAQTYRIRRATVDNFLNSGSLGTITPPTTQFDDLTAVPGQQYFYWLEVNQTLNTQFLATTTNGVSGLRLAPPNVPPVANAGTDQTVTDTDNSGSETVTLNGSGSSDSDGTIASYTWRLAGNTILTGVSGQVSLPVGASSIELTVVDDDGAPAVDTVLITVNPGQPSGCDGIDFNNDGSFFDPLDIDSFLSVFAEGPCLPSGATCNDIDFNNDSASFDPCDIDSFLLVFAEGPCTPCGQ